MRCLAVSSICVLGGIIGQPLKRKKTPRNVKKRSADASQDETNGSHEEGMFNTGPLPVKSECDAAKHKEHASEYRCHANYRMHGAGSLLFELRDSAREKKIS